jgi:hypothetical protein
MKAKTISTLLAISLSLLVAATNLISLNYKAEAQQTTTTTTTKVQVGGGVVIFLYLIFTFLSY